MHINVDRPVIIHDDLSEIECEYHVYGGGALTLIPHSLRGYPEPRVRRVVLVEEGAQATTIGAFEGKEKESLLVTFDTIHQAPNTTARTEFRAVLQDTSFFEFRGLIKILSGAHGSQDFLQQDSLLLSDDARAVAIPSLEIETNDVKASHGATAKTISPEERFYLMSRGLTKDDAERMIVDGFLAPIRSRYIS